MGSLSRRPNGRKQSAVRNAFSSSPSSTFSLKNPYDDVLFSKRGKKKFATHEYAEIFSGSSSIPVLDLSSLDERVGSAECRSSRLDYSNIFGGLGNDEVALPYEELLNGAAKKTKTQSPADASLSCQEPGSLHPSEKTKRSSGEASDQSIDGVKQHFNISFNKTSQRISNASNGKTHIAQLHAVPGFTYFVDGTPRPQKKGLRPSPSLKREVSHTWSFSEGVEVATVQDRSTWENLHVSDKSCNVGEVKLKPCSMEVPLPASHLSNPNDNNDPSGPGFPSFDSKEASKRTAGESSPPLSDEELDKNSVVALSAAVLNKAVEQAQESSCNVGEVKLEPNSAEVPLPASHLSNPNDNNDPNCFGFPIFESKDASKRTAGESSPPLSDEELDKNSVAALSAAALKKAVEQAQESIRIARMIMERKKDGFQGGPKPSSKSRLRVKDKKETGSEHEADGSKDNYARVTYEKLNSTFPIFTGINEKFAPSLYHSEKLLNTGKAEVERVRENVEAAKEHKDEFAEAGKRFAASWSPSGARHTAENVALENVGEHVEVAEACRAAINFTGLVPNGECRTETLDPGKVHNHDNRACFADKPPFHLQEMENGKETIRRLTIHQPKGEEFIAELSERAPNTSKRAQQLEKSVDDALVQCQATTDLVKEPESVSKSSEEVLNSSQSMQEQEKIVHEAGEHLRISQEDEVTDERDDTADDKVRCEIVENEHMVLGEHLTVRKPEFNSWLDKSQSLDEKGMLGQEHTEKLFETYPNWEENEQHGESGDEKENGLIYKVEHLWFESEQQLKEKISERKSEIFPKVEEVGEEVNVVNESEIDDNKLGHDGDGHKSFREFKEYEIVERHMDTSEFEPADTTQTAASNFAEVQKGEVDWGTEETIDIQKGARRSEDNLDKINFWECGSERDIGEAIDACNNDFGTISNDAHGNDTSNAFSEIQEPCDTEFNKAEHYQSALEGYKENGSLSRATETFSAVEDKETGKLFHQEVNDMPGTDSLHRCTPEQNIIGGKLNSALEDFWSDTKTENASLIDADHEEKLLRDEDIFTTVSEIQIAAQEDDAKINMQNFPDLCPNNKAADFDHRSIRQALKRTVSASILGDIHGVSTHGTQECSANAEDKTLNKEEVERGLDMSSDGKEYVEERSELYFEDRSVEEYSQPNDPPEGTEKSMETRICVETDQIMEKDKENHSRVSSMQKKDAEGDEQKFETNDCRQRIEAIKRGREREKDRIAVERAIREARERAFAEARERAERAAAERAAAEVRQRVKAEAREKLAKASMESKQPVDKLSTEAKIRAERAAVERATVEARERALEKAVSQKTFIEVRAQAEGYSTERFSSSSRNRGLKHSFSSSDLEKFDGTTSESAQRCKARLERHQRIMERAAKALAEKNKRDLLAQKELAERNRLAESLDGDIRRWVAGKEGNLRALLSTLQYILGPDSGWQPTSLTEIITSAAVKKAYRKATLCVHPDKLQQRGASIQQKYICEKVFDLLKAAWNRFNSEES